MPDLLIRYLNGERYVAKDYSGGSSRLECVLHDKEREKRVKLSDEEALLSLNVLTYLYDHKKLEAQK